MRTHAEIGWTVTIEVADLSLPELDNGLYGAFVELMTPWGGSVGGATTHARYSATFSWRRPAASPAEALDAALGTFRWVAATAGMPELPVVVCELMTFAEHDRTLAG